MKSPKAIEIKNVTKTFGGKVVLDKCSFKIEKNKITSLVGPNGCGKTTLFNIICCMLDCDNGSILYKNKDLITLRTSNIAKLGIARTFQDPKLFKNLTVCEHLNLAVRDNSSFWRNITQRNKLTNKELERIEQVLIDLKLDKKRNFLPKDLSGGQRKLLDLGVVLVSNFDLILLDEPFAGVAPSLRGLICDLVLELKKKGKTVFLIEHDMEYVMKMSDEIVVLDKGKVLAQDIPKVIKKNNKVLDAYLGR